MELSTSKAGNYTDDFFGPSPYAVIGREVFITVGIVLVIVGITGSLFLLIICSLDQTLRRSSKHFLLLVITILCTLEQCLGAFIVHTHIDNIDIVTTYGCEVSYFISAASYISVSVVVLLVAAIAFDTVLTLHMKPLSSPAIRICIAMEWVILIVVVSALILLPLMNVSSYKLTCSVYMKEHYMLALNVIHFLPQVLVLVLADLVLMMVYTRKQGRRSEEDTPLPFPTDIFLASAFVVLLKLPDFIFSFGFNFCTTAQGSCSGMYLFWAVATYLGTGLYALLPYVWLSGRDTREGVVRVFRYCGCCSATYRQDMYILTSPEPV